MSREIIHKEMMELGRKFSDIAYAAETVKGARSAFDLAERAFKLAITAEPKMKPSILDMNATFLSQLLTDEKRSQVWLGYLDFCDEYSMLPIAKREFFKALEQYGFKIKMRNGEWYVIPPKLQPRVLQIAAERFEAGIKIDASQDRLETGDDVSE